jgi:hypothetical protein
LQYTEAEGVTAIAGAGFTASVSVTVDVAAQASVITNVYVPAVAGAAMTVGFCTVDVKLFGPVHA